MAGLERGAEQPKEAFSYTWYLADCGLPSGSSLQGTCPVVSSTRLPKAPLSGSSQYRIKPTPLALPAHSSARRISMAFGCMHVPGSPPTPPYLLLQFAEGHLLRFKGAVVTD